MLFQQKTASPSSEERRGEDFVSYTYPAARDRRPLMMHIRLARLEDRDAIMVLIDTVLHEYDDRLWPQGADSDLLDLTSHYMAKDGAFIVLDDAGHIRGTHAVVPDTQRPGVCYLRRLYLDAALRGSSWGTQLMQWTLDWARTHGMHRVEFWSDTRFTRAHAFFARFGFQRDGRVRTMHDGWKPYQEYFYFLPVVPLSDVPIGRPGG
jgi:putative acetyltransferase